MSIRAVANFYKIRWHTVKDLEKQYLQKKYARIQTAQVRSIGLDEIYVSRKSNESKYLTVIRDLKSGVVLFVGDGKGIRALEGTEKMLKKSELRLVAMDMSNAYSSWFREHFPEAKIVFDHFSYYQAEETKIPELKTMAKTIRNNLDGIKTYWTFRHQTNAKTEGFNNKIRWLIRQVYVFRDREYFKLKIFQLPENSGIKEL